MGKNIISVFTKKHTQIVNRLFTRVVLSANDISDQALAQWDTGATNTCISEEVAQTYNLKPISFAQSKTPSGTFTASLYLIDIILNNEVIFPKWTVMGSKIGAQGIDILIGMDIISKGDFAISNFNGKTHFSFRLPSQEDVDYKQNFLCEIAATKEN